MNKFFKKEIFALLRARDIAYTLDTSYDRKQLAFDDWSIDDMRFPINLVVQDLNFGNWNYHCHRSAFFFRTK